MISASYNWFRTHTVLPHLQNGLSYLSIVTLFYHFIVVLGTKDIAIMAKPQKVKKFRLGSHPVKTSVKFWDTLTTFLSHGNLLFYIFNSLPMSIATKLLSTFPIWAWRHIWTTPWKATMNQQKYFTLSIAAVSLTARPFKRFMRTTTMRKTKARRKRYPRTARTVVVKL